MKIEQETVSVNTVSASASSFASGSSVKPESDPNGDAQAHVTRLVREGIAMAKAGNLPVAREILITAIGLDGKHETALMWLASISDKPHQLLDYLQRVLVINPSNERAAQWATATRSLLAKSYIQQGAASHKEGMPEIAAQYFLQATEYEPINEMAWLWLVSVAYEPEDKLSYLNRVLSLNPTHEKALALFHRTKTQIARSLLKKGNAAAVSGDRETARDILRDVMEYNSNLEEAWLLQAFLSDSDEEKILCFEKALEINPESSQAQSGLESFQARAASAEQTAETSFDAEGETEEFTGTMSVAQEFNGEEIEEERSFEENSAPQAVEPQTGDSETDNYHETISFDESASAEEISPVQSTEDVSETTETTTPITTIERDEDFVEDDTVATQFVAEHYVAVESVNEESIEEDLVQEQMLAVPEVASNLPSDFSNTLAPRVESNLVNQDASADLLPTAEQPEISAESALELTPVEELAAELDLQPETETVSEIENDRDNQLNAVSPPEELVAEEILEATTENTVVAVAPENVILETAPETIVECQFCHAFTKESVSRCQGCGAFTRLEKFDSLLANELNNESRMRGFIEKWQTEAAGRELTAEEYFNLGLGYLNLHNVKKAVNNFEQVLKLGETNDRNWNFEIAALLAYVKEKMPEVLGNTVPGSGKTIMVVDDSPTVRKLIVGKLEKHGHRVVSAVDGMDALAKINDIIPDLILLDVTMPRLDGYQLCKMVKANAKTKHVPVVMISGKDGFFDKVRGRMAGSTAYITKPFGPETLLQTVDNYCS